MPAITSTVAVRYTRPRQFVLFAVAALVAACLDDSVAPAPAPAPPPVATVDRVELSAPTASLEQGETMTLTAVALDAAGRAIEGRQVAWTSDAPAVTVDATGTLTGVQTGEARVTATIDNHAATAVVTVRVAAVASVTVAPSGFVIEIGETRQLFAVMKDARGHELRDRAVEWSIDTDAARVSPDGMLVGAKNAYITIRASSEGVAGVAVATIVPAEATEFDLAYYRYSNTNLSELFTLTPGTGAPPVRINAGTVSRTPSPSPDGSRLAFAVFMTLPTGERVDDIFAVDRNGLNMRRLTTLAGSDDAPAWSPAGDRIAFHHWDGNRSDVWIMNADGSTPVSLTGDMPAEGFRGEPAWSPDGTRIAFASLDNGPRGTTASIWIMNADGTGKEAIVSGSPGFDASPAWSPDGTRLVFVRHYAGGADLTIMRIVDGATERIRLDGLESKPAWSPDGTLIAFSSGARNELFTIQPDGGKLRLRTVMPAWGGGLAPVWIRR